MRRGRNAHKWQAAVYLVAGSPGMTGAAELAATAALRSGAGMLRLGSPGAMPGSVPVTEAVARALPAEGWAPAVLEETPRCHALVVGPGLGTSAATRESVAALVRGADLPLVLDADGLNALGLIGEDGGILATRSAPTVLTPHDGEFARLAGGPPGEDRIAAARELARRSHAVVLLKGSTTIVADPGGDVLLAAAGSSRLATAGTGDVLSGVIGAFLARGVPPLRAAALAAHVHGRAAGAGRSQGLLAGDLPALVATVLSDFADRTA
jgi:NAD(P)H-hydrate epimerase